MPKKRATARPKRKRDAAATREAILEAATGRFATQGYERAGAREIAADAGETAALVNRYFGSKEGLFAAVIERAFNCGYYLEGPLESLPDRLARKLVFPLESSDPELAHELALRGQLIAGRIAPLADHLLDAQRDVLIGLAASDRDLHRHSLAAHGRLTCQAI
jgi:AcrR family transcriptional regulator